MHEQNDPFELFDTHEQLSHLHNHKLQFAADSVAVQRRAIVSYVCISFSISFDHVGSCRPRPSLRHCTLATLDNGTNAAQHSDG